MAIIIVVFCTKVTININTASFSFAVVSILTRFGKRDLFDKNIILRNKQLKTAYIYTAMLCRILVIFGISEPVFLKSLFRAILVALEWLLNSIYQRSPFSQSHHKCSCCHKVTKQDENLIRYHVVKCTEN